MESHRLILINLVIPPINPVPRDRSNIGELSGSRYISLISGDIVSLSYGLQLCKMDGQQNLCHRRIFSRHIIFTIRKMSLGIRYYDNVLLWRSDDGRGDLHFLPVTEISTRENNPLHMGSLFFQTHRECSTPCEYIRNKFEKIISPCNCQCIIKLFDSH